MENPQPNTEDRLLVRRALEGERGAFDALVTRHMGLVYAIACARLGDRERAEDLAQEVFLRAFLALDRLDDPNKFAAWSSQITRNLAISWLRRDSRIKRLALEVPLGEGHEDLPDTQSKGARHQMESRERESALWKAIQSLPPEERELVLLHFSEGISANEIGRRFGVHQTTISRRIQRALSQMHGLLEPTLREQAPALKVPPQLTSRTLVLIAGAAAMSAASKTALAAKATQDVSALAQVPAVAVGIVTSLKAAWAALILGGKSMATAKGAAALVAAVIIIGGGIGYHMTHSQGTSSASSNDATPTITSAITSEGTGDTFTMQLDLSPGTRWTTTERTETQRDDDPNRVTATTIVSDHRVLDEVDENTVRLERVIRDATMDASGVQQPPNAMIIESPDYAQRMQGMRTIELVDLSGQVISTEIVESPPRESDSDRVLRLLGNFDRSMMLSVPDHPVRIGESWRAEFEIPGANGITAVCESTVNDVARNAQGVTATIFRTLSLDIDGPLTLPRNHSEMMNVPTETETTILSGHLVGTIESRFAVNEGRWLHHTSSTEGNMTIRVRIELPPEMLQAAAGRMPLSHDGQAVIREERIHESRRATIEVDSFESEQASGNPIVQIASSNSGAVEIPRWSMEEMAEVFTSLGDAIAQHRLSSIPPDGSLVLNVSEDTLADLEFADQELSGGGRWREVTPISEPVEGTIDSWLIHFDQPLQGHYLMIADEGADGGEPSCWVIAIEGAGPVNPEIIATIEQNARDMIQGIDVNTRSQTSRSN